jgi:hypothetical protein
LISPLTSFAISAYGTLRTAARGVISGSAPTFTPRYLTEPSKIFVPNGTLSPRLTEKYPSSNVIACSSVQSAAPPEPAS